MEGPAARTGGTIRFSARVWSVLIGCAAMLSTGTAPAEALAPPTGDVLLVVSGKVTNANVGEQARFDRALLESLGTTKIVTRTAWHDKFTEFEGVLARRLLEAVGADGDTVIAIAANDYKVTIPAADFTSFDVLLATHVDGEELRLRTKGPIWLIYPEDVDLPPLVRQERMIWQLIELHVE